MPRLEFGWTCALLSPEGGVCVRWCNVVPFQAAGQGISREDSAAQPGAERLQAAFRPRRNSQPLSGVSGIGRKRLRTPSLRSFRTCEYRSFLVGLALKASDRSDRSD